MERRLKRPGCKRYRIQLLYKFQTLKAPIKLSRRMAIFEFSSSNGLSSFNLLFECRSIQIREIEDKNDIYFAYLVWLPDALRSETACEERGYEDFWEKNSSNCITTFQG